MLDLQQSQQYTNKLSSVIQVERMQGQVQIVSKPVRKLKCIDNRYFYDETRILGEGYASVVYCGFATGKQEEVLAIKVIQKRKVKKDNLELFQNELKIHSRLSHQNVIQCYETIQNLYFYFLILEYCPEGDLESYVKTRNRELSEEQILSIMKQIVQGYKYLIEQKVIHRDLKPPNILKKGNQWKIGDFGFALENKREYIGDINVGTPFYMAPQALQRSYYSYKTDIFALGVISYELIARKVPWEYKSQKVLQNKMKQQNPDFKAIYSLKTAAIAYFTIKCCQPNERKRMSVKEFLQFSFDCQDSKLFHQTIEKRKQQDEPQSKINNKSVWSYNKAQDKGIMRDSRRNGLNFKKSAEQNDPALKINDEILKNQKDLCYFLFFMMKNNSSFLFHDHYQKELFLMIAFKHLGYQIRRLINPKQNLFNLLKWNKYTQSKNYALHFQEMQNLSEQAKNIMEVQIQSKNIQLVRIVNKNYSQLGSDAQLPSNCIQELQKFTIQLLKTLDERIQEILQPPISKINDYSQFFQAFESLLSYLMYLMKKNQVKSELVHIEYDEFINRTYTICENYRKSTLNFQDHNKNRRILTLFKQNSEMTLKQ